MNEFSWPLFPEAKICMQLWEIEVWEKYFDFFRYWAEGSEGFRNINWVWIQTVALHFWAFHACQVQNILGFCENF